MATYSQKLKDHRWLEKRARILERDNHRCRYCDMNDRPLQVHHVRYSGQPWEVQDKYLLTLCDLCHGEIEDMKKKAQLVIEQMQLKLGIWRFYSWIKIGSFILKVQSDRAAKIYVEDELERHGREEECYG